MANPTTNFGWVMPTATDLVTDLPADFAVFGQGVDTSMAYLLGGTTGQILSKTSATNMAFTWINNDQGDLTAITAGTGISVTSGTGPIPSVAIDTTVTVDKTTAQTLTNKTLTSPALTTPTISTLTTNGDLVYGTGSGALSRLGIGSSSQVLTVASGVPSWATPATGGGMTLISTTTMNAGNFTLSSIAGSYKHLKLVLVDVYLNTGAEFFWIRCNGDTGSNYQRRFIQLTGTTVSGATSIQTTHLISQAGTANTNITNGFANIDLYNYTTTSGGQLIVSQSSGYNGADNYGVLNTGVYNKSAAITSITVGANNTFAGGTCFFYGVS